MDLEAVRTFAAAAAAGQFAGAADDLSITQQAVSKRIATLEKDLGVRLFTRTARGAQLTTEGRAFLPHARDLLQAAERAALSVRPGRRALRVDVIGRRLAPAALLRGFHRAHPGTELEVMTHLLDAGAAIAAVRSGTIDASFRAVTLPAPRLPDGIEAARVLDEPVQLLVGPAHQFAAARAVTPAELATFVGEQTHLLWPAGYDLLRIALHDPAPVYPHSLIWRRDNPHPALTTLRTYLGSTSRSSRHAETWTPNWAGQKQQSIF